MTHAITNFFKGMLIGASNIIPGVSGGTIAVVLGIFDMLIDSINNFYKGFDNFKKHFTFLLPIGLGVVFSIGALSSLISFLLENQTFPTVLFFIGLVVGSIPIICKKSSTEGFKPAYLAVSVFTFLIVILMTYAKVSTPTSTTADNPFFFMLKMFASGIVAAAAMVIPGISGSFVMILMGMYETVVQTISAFVSALISFDLDALVNNTILILPLAVGIILGILLVSKIISLLLEKFYSITYFAILGLVVGSVFGLAIDLISTSNNVDVSLIIIGIVTFFSGAILSLKLGNE